MNALSLLGCLFSMGTGALESAPSAWGDFDADGRPDLFVASPAGDRLLHNRGDGGFDVIPLPGETASASRFGLWHDFDGDGRLDLYRAQAPFPGTLLRNLGNGTFEPYAIAVEEAAGGARGDVLAARFVDYDGDGRADLEVHGAFGAALYHQKKGWFERVDLAGPLGAALPPTRPSTTEEASTAAPPAAASPTGGSRTIVRGGGSSGMTTGGLGSSPLTTPLLMCADTLLDQATSACLKASSVPLLGHLYPLSVDFNLDGSGRVGMGTTTPQHRLHVTATNGLENVVYAEGANTGFGISVIHGSTTSPNAGAIGVEGSVDGALTGQNSAGVAGFHHGTTSSGFGVWGTHDGSGIGVYGQAANGTGLWGVSTTSDAVRASSVSGRAIYAARSSTIGTEPAIYGASWSSTASASAIHGIMVPTTTAGANSAAVRGESRSTTGFGIGVYGSHDGSGWGAYGRSQGGIGVIGYTGSSSSYGVYSSGDFGGTGSKYFIQPHPTDASKEIRYVCLEGDESGTYFRGSSQLIGGQAVIEVPESFRLVTEGRLTVQLTAVGADARLWVVSKDLDRIVVEGSADVEFDYFVNGVRRGFAEHEPIRDNHSFVPELRGVPYGTQYPDAYRRILVENGILNEDMTPNENTAARLGWELRDPVEIKPVSTATPD